METKFNFKCPICGKTVMKTDVIRTMTGGVMCMRCYLRSQDNERREYGRAQFQ